MIQITQPKGMVSKETNKEAIARVFSLRKRQVGYLSTTNVVDSYTVLYDESTQTCWYRGTATGTPTSWTISGNSMSLVTTTGTYNLNKAVAITSSILSSPQGFSYVGQVDTFDALRTLTPLFDGAVVILKSYYSGGKTGGGKFIGKLGTGVDDGGFTAAGTGFYWERIDFKEVNLLDFGVYLQAGTAIKNSPNTAVDMTAKVQAAVAKSIALGVPLQSPFYLGNDIGFVSNGILLMKSLYLNGIKNMLGDYPFFSYSGVGVYDEDVGLTFATGTSEPYVVFNMNANFDSNGRKYYGTNRGGQRIGKIVVYNLGGRSVHLNGQIHCMKNSTIECLHSSQLQGVAVNMTTSFDYQIKELGAHSSGDYNYFALDGAAYPAADRMDEHNAYTIESLFAHDCYEHSLRILGSKGNIIRVHEEATQVNSTTDYAGYGSSYGSLNGYGYTTSMLGGTGSVIGAYSVQALSTSANPVVAMMTMYGTTFNNVYTNNSVHTAIIAQGNAANSIGAIKVLSGSLIINDQARVAIGTANITGNLSMKDTRSSIGNLIIAGDVTNLYGTIHRALVTGNLTLHPIGVVDYGTVSGNMIINQGWAGGNYARNMIVSGNLSVVNGGGTRAYLDNMIIRGTFIASNGTNMIFTNSRVDGTTTLNGTSLNLEVNTSQFAGLTIDAAATGIWLFGLGCKVGGALTGWKVPTTAPRSGSINTNPGTGLTQIYLAGAWKTLIAAAA